ncbi:TPA: hypothetical protein NJ685_000227 [Vibrio parahaemolyticus]|nr:hypothetical protein [Vibrio parahaemolyticus]
MKVYFISGELIAVDHIETVRTDRGSCVVQMVSGRIQAYDFLNPSHANLMRSDIFKLMASPAQNIFVESELELKR